MILIPDFDSSLIADSEVESSLQFYQSTVTNISKLCVEGLFLLPY